MKVAGQQRPRERVLDEPLDRPLERPRAERRVRALAHDQRAGRRRQLEHEVRGREPPLEVGEQEVDDRRQVRVGQRVEHDDLVDPVEELGPEVRRAARR